MGKKKQWTKERINALKEKLREYIDEEDIPIAKEFAYKNDVPRSRIYVLRQDDPEFGDLMDKLSDKKEANLEKMALYGKIDRTMAVFSLKQMGWKDRQETDNTHTIERRIVYENEDGKV